MVAGALRLLPAPNNFDIGDQWNTAGFRFNNPRGGRGDTYMARIDHRLTNTVNLFFRPIVTRASNIDGGNGGDATFPGQVSATVDVRVSAFSLGVDWTLSPRATNNFRIGRSVIALFFNRPARLAGAMLSASAWTNPLNTQFAQMSSPVVYEVTDHFSRISGNHAFKFGIDFRFLRVESVSFSGVYPDVFMDLDHGNAPSATIGTEDVRQFQILYNHLLGRISSVQQTFYSNLKVFGPTGMPRNRNYRTHGYDGFLQDDWKLRRNLTLNLGLRYEFNGVPFEKDGLQATVDQVAQISRSSQIADLTLVPNSRWYKNDWNNLAPRFGLAWDPKGDGKSALRASYGIFYDALTGGTMNFVDLNTPGFSQISWTYPNETPNSDHRLRDGIDPVPARAPRNCASRLRGRPTSPSSARISAPGMCSNTASPCNARSSAIPCSRLRLWVTAE